jgi:hypothetical protein
VSLFQVTPFNKARLLLFSKTKTKKPPQRDGIFKTLHQRLTLTRLKTGLCFIDNIHTAFAAYHTTIAVAALKRAKRVFDLHGLLLQNRAAE